MDGKNILDFIDPDIDAKLAELEAEVRREREEREEREREKREKGRETERDRATETESHRERDTERHIDKERYLPSLSQEEERLRLLAANIEEVKTVSLS